MRLWCARLLRLRDDPNIWLGWFPAAGIILLCLFVRNRGQDDHVLALFPIHRCDHFVFRSELNGFQDAQNFIEIVGCAHGIAERQLDLLVRSDKEDSASGGVVCGGAPFGTVSAIGGQYVVELGDVQLGIADHWEVHLVALSFLDIHGPLGVTSDGVDVEADNLAVTPLEFGLEAGHVAEPSGADGCEVRGARKEDGSAVADPFVGIELALRGLRRKIGGFVVDAQGHPCSLSTPIEWACLCMEGHSEYGKSGSIVGLRRAWGRVLRAGQFVKFAGTADAMGSEASYSTCP
jgi:hypothetical protein